jgi:hypothetical protein
VTQVNTKQVPNRRKLRFNSLDDIERDVEILAAAREVKTLGNMTAGQNLAHVALTMTCSLDGFPGGVPALLRFIVRLFLKRRVLTKPMAPGFKSPPKVKMVPPPVPLEEGIAQMRAAIARLKKESQRSPSPLLGPLSVQEWNDLHCRHAELHFSFLIPVE